MKGLRLNYNGTIDVLEAPKKISCEWIAKNIGCEWVEIVRPPKRLKRGYVMIVDEEGLCKRNVLNIVGSWLFESETHGSPIAGDVMIIKEVMGPEGPEFGGLTDKDVEDLKKDLGWDWERLSNYALELKKAM